MRGRHSYAILRQLGATDTIADSFEDYTEIAVRPGSDADYRRKISRQIAAGHDRLFNDRPGLDALETFYKRVVGEQLARLSLDL